MGSGRSREVVLDAGALIAIERGDARMTALLELSLSTHVQWVVPACVLAQAWRNGARQTRLTLFLKAPEVTVVPLSEATARAVGVLCGLSKTRDVVDASVVLAARERRCAVVTGDPDDLSALDSAVRLHVL